MQKSSRVHTSTTAVHKTGLHKVSLSELKRLPEDITLQEQKHSKNKAAAVPAAEAAPALQLRRAVYSLPLSACCIFALSCRSTCLCELPR